MNYFCFQLWRAIAYLPFFLISDENNAFKYALVCSTRSFKTLSVAAGEAVAGESAVKRDPDYQHRHTVVGLPLVISGGLSFIGIIYFNIVICMVALYKENYLDCLRINIYNQYLSFDRLYNTV